MCVKYIKIFFKKNKISKRILDYYKKLIYSNKVEKYGPLAQW
ncbi:hypothetical protein CWO_02925 [Buchnera aphidicola str. LL01 (Acyrthosiphon pisum)]|nr:hypothetical protein CWO_02925 [Buchnera aphidicola str. LL01 (Acyrthosiphon pisum)]